MSNFHFPVGIFQFLFAVFFNTRIFYSNLFDYFTFLYIRTEVSLFSQNNDYGPCKQQNVFWIFLQFFCKYVLLDYSDFYYRA